MYHKPSKKRLRTVILPNGRAMLIQRLECGIFAVCGPLDRYGCVDYEYSKWWTLDRGRRTVKRGA